MRTVGSTGDRSRRIALVVIALLFVVSAVAFQSTVTAYVTLDKVTTADVVVEDVSYDEDAERATATLAFENPTGSSVEIFGAALWLKVDGEKVTQFAGTSMESVSVGPHESERLTVQLPIREDAAEAAERVESDPTATVAISGDLKLEVRGEVTRMRIEWSR